MPRFHVSADLSSNTEMLLPPGAARHVQVLRLQPGSAITVFDGHGGEWEAQVTHMGRSEVRVQVGQARMPMQAATRSVRLFASQMSSDRMDWLMEKATELGATSMTPVLTERSSLRLSGERAEKKRAHWQAVAIAACEQSGRNHVPVVCEPCSFDTLLKATGRHDEDEESSKHRLILSIAKDALPLRQAMASWQPADSIALLTGPEGGFSSQEESDARLAGWQPVSLGQHVLRAETAPLAALAVILI